MDVIGGQTALPPSAGCLGALRNRPRFALGSPLQRLLQSCVWTHAHRCKARRHECGLRAGDLDRHYWVASPRPSLPQAVRAGFRRLRTRPLLERIRAGAQAKAASHRMSRPRYGDQANIVMIGKCLDGGCRRMVRAFPFGRGDAADTCFSGRIPAVCMHTCTCLHKASYVLLEALRRHMLGIWRPCTYTGICGQAIGCRWEAWRRSPHSEVAGGWGSPHPPGRCRLLKALPGVWIVCLRRGVCCRRLCRSRHAASHCQETSW